MFNEKIKKLRKEKNMRQMDIANYLGVAEATYGRYELGNRQPDFETLHKLASYFNVTTDYLLSDKIDMTPVKVADENETYGVPLRLEGYGSCGGGKNNDDFVSDEFFIVPKEWLKGNVNDYFFAYASGDSMIEAHIVDGAILLFKEQPTLVTGQIGAFYLNGDIYIKRYKELDNGSIVLQSENRGYDPIYVTKDDEFRVIAKLVRINIVLQ